MAQARLEKFGTIYTRVSSLLHGGAMHPMEKPVWYAVYEAFPPKYEPRYNRVPPRVPIRKIYYEEDILRARFHKDCEHLETINLLRRSKYESQTQKFLNEYNNLRKLDLSEDIAYEEALKVCTSSKHTDKDQKKSNTEQKE